MRIVIFSGLLFLASCCDVHGQLTVLESPGFGFADIGYNAVSDEVVILTTQGSFGDTDYGIARINANNDGFVHETLGNLPGATEKFVVNDISNDGSRLAGQVFDENSLPQASTWTTADPQSVVFIGRPDNLPVSSSALAAWSGGVVGDFPNWLARWDAGSGFDATPSNGTLLFRGVSADGEVAVGTNFRDEIIVWEDDTLTAIGTSLDARNSTISPNGNIIAGSMRDFTAPARAAIWNRVETGWESQLLSYRNGNNVYGYVTEVTDNGYSIGFNFDTANSIFEGYIHHDSLGGAVPLNEWLLSYDPTLQLPSNLAAGGIHWDETSDTLRLVSGSEQGGLYFEVQLSAVPEPNSLIVLFAFAPLVLTHRRRVN